MNIVKNITAWRELHKDSLVIPFIRILFGILIFYKAIYFIVKGDEMESIMMDTIAYLPFLFGHWIPMFEIAAGILVGIGLLTRACSLFQIPLFIAALVFAKSNALMEGFEQSQNTLSVVILVLSIFFAFWGNGAFSAQRALVKENKREEDHFWHRDTKE